MSIPKEPRQLMINLMYLVLTALLALNVSNEVLNAFTIVDESIQQSNGNIETKNAGTMVNFSKVQDDEKLEPKKRAKVVKAEEVAKQARAITNKMISDLDAYRNDIVTKSGGYEPDDKTGVDKLKKESDLDVPTRYMIKQGNGKQMLAKLQQYKKDMAALIGDLPEDMRLYASESDFAKTLPLNLDARPGQDWEVGLFNMVPSVAAVTIIDKFKNDVKNSESAVLDELWASAMGEKQTKPIVPKRVFDQYGVIARLDNSYVLPGQTMNLNAMLGAYNANSAGLRIFVNGQQVSTKGGIADKTIKASSTPGQHSIKVTAQYQDLGDNDTEIKTWKNAKDFTLNYFVGQPAATISLDKMKILYKGLDNPISVSASGIPLSNLIIKPGPNLRLKTVDKSKGKYEVAVSKYGGTSTIELLGKLSDGTTKSFGVQTYRLGRVPDPKAYVANKESGSMPVGVMKVQRGVFAKLLDFPYELKYEIVSYTIFHLPKRDDPPPPVTVNSQFLFDSRGDSRVNAIGKNLRVGDRLIFEQIKAKGPDGEIRKLPGVQFYFPN